MNRLEVMSQPIIRIQGENELFNWPMKMLDIKEKMECIDRFLLDIWKT